MNRCHNKYVGEHGTSAHGMRKAGIEFGGRSVSITKNWMQIRALALTPWPTLPADEPHIQVCAAQGSNPSNVCTAVPSRPHALSGKPSSMLPPLPSHLLIVQLVAAADDGAAKPLANYLVMVPAPLLLLLPLLFLLGCSAQCPYDADCEPLHALAQGAQLLAEQRREHVQAPEG